MQILCDNTWLKNSIKKLQTKIRKDEVLEKEYSCSKKDMVVCLCFFSIIEYKKPVENYNTVISKLKKNNIPVKTISVIFPGQKKKNLNFDYCFTTDSVLFYKENLYSILFSKLKDKYSKFCFIDGDVIFDNEEWYDQTSNLLEHFDLAQPFDTCKWIQKDNVTSDTGQIASSVAMYRGINFEQAYYHPGFSWAFKKDIFEKINGFYEWSFIGEGDLCFLNSFMLNRNNKINLPITRSNKYKKYSENIVKNNLKMGFLKNNTAYHLYHGSYENRRYEERLNCIKDAFVIGEHPDRYLVKDPDGLLRWRYPANHNEEIRIWFRRRREDE